MDNPIIKADKNTKQSLFNDLNALIIKYKTELNSEQLLDYVIRYTFSLLEMDNTIKTEYNEVYCDLFIDYATKNMNPGGFWGRYKIDEGVKNEWMKKYHKFKQTVSLIPNITVDLMNQNLQHIIAAASKAGDVKTSTQICLKLIDVLYRTEKEMGTIKDRGMENKTSKKRSASELDESAVEMAEEFLRNDIE